MKVLLLFGIICTVNFGSLHGASVKKFLESYANAPNNDVRMMLIKDMLGEVNGKTIEDIFDDYDETHENDFNTIMKNRDFLKREDRDYLDNVLKYSKVANSKWGQILQHPEKIPNPASVLQWDMKKLIKQALNHPGTRQWILSNMLQSIRGQNIEDIQQEIKEKIGDKYKDANDYLNSILIDKNVKLDKNFHTSDADRCGEAIEATWGYPLDILLQILKLIGWQIVQVLVDAYAEQICNNDPGQIGEIIMNFLCDGSIFCEALYPTVCPVVVEAISRIEIAPLKQQGTLIPAIAMIDATAKIPSGILELKLHWPGDYQLCENVFGEYITFYDNFNITHPFTGRYCRVDVGFADSEDEEPWGLPIGICVPNQCADTRGGRQYIQDRLTNPVGLLGLGVVDVFCGHEESLGDKPEAQSSLTVISIIAAIALCATVWDGFFRKKWLAKKFNLSNSNKNKGPSYGNHSFKPNGITPTSNGVTKYEESLKRLSSLSSSAEMIEAELTEPVEFSERAEAAFTGFSFYSNLRRIFSTDTQTEEDFSAVHFLRFFSLSYLMLGETYFLGTLFTELWAVGNFLSWIMTLPRQWFYQPIINVHFSADTFFVISGFLACYWFLRRVEKNAGKLKFTHITRFIFHKYFALVIPMMLTLFFYTTWYKFLLGGPLAPVKIDDAEFCKENWWTNLLLVHNLVNRTEKCVSWTWYVACVFQLHVVTLIFVLIPISIGKIGRYFGYFMIFALWAVHVGLNSYYALRYYGLIEFITDIEGWYRDLLQLPWNRAGAYLVGTVFGIIMFRIRKKEIKISWPIDMIGWLGSIAVIAAVTFSTYDMVKEEGSGPVMWSKERLVAWEVLSRSAWATCICWIIFSIQYGGGGFLRCLINWKIWLPLARLTYTSYLIHAVIISRFIYAQMSLVEMTQDTVWYFFIGNLLFSLAAGCVISLLFHLPFVNLEAAFFYLNSKGSAMMFGRHPYEGINLKLDETGNHITPVTRNGIDNYGMVLNDGIYKTSDYTSDVYFNADRSMSTHENVYEKPVHVTEL